MQHRYKPCVICGKMVEFKDSNHLRNHPDKWVCKSHTPGPVKVVFLESVDTMKAVRSDEDLQDRINQ